LPETSSKNLQRQRFVDTDGKHVGGKQKRSQAIKKSREKKVGERKLDLTKVKIAFQFPTVRQKLMVREMIRKRKVANFRATNIMSFSPPTIRYFCW
jgi:hypothetical protein